MNSNLQPNIGSLRKFLTVFFLLSSFLATRAAEKLAAGVRGLATHAPGEMKIDGDLAEFQGAFCTPVEYFGPDSKVLHDRAGQFFYMWDEEAFYAGLRTLDTRPANFAPDDRLWEGDGVEWYFDVRRGADFRNQAWPTTPNPNAVHCYWVGLKGTNVQGRFCLRPGFLQAISKTGVQVASRRTAAGMEVEFKLPWANFPGFKPKAGEVIALDAELCYGDGDSNPARWRVARSFAYGSPLSVQQPASLGLVQLVEKLESEHWAQCGPVMLPIRCDTAWTQPGKPQVTAFMAVPPGLAASIGKIVFRVSNLTGSAHTDYPAQLETFEKEGDFRRAVAHWPVEAAPPGAHQVMGIVYDMAGKELTRIAPRLVSVHMDPGY